MLEYGLIIATFKINVEAICLFNFLREGEVIGSFNKAPYGHSIGKQQASCVICLLLSDFPVSRMSGVDVSTAYSYSPHGIASFSCLFTRSGVIRPRCIYSISSLLVSLEFCCHSVYLYISVRNDCKFWKNGQFDQDVSCGGGLGGFQGTMY